MTPAEQYLCLSDLFPGSRLAADCASLPYGGESGDDDSEPADSPPLLFR